jgi:catechol 2,3-dioxygenase-like lactoylglutathione lyase family enzyme
MRTNMSEEKKKTETDGPSVGGCSNIGIHHVGLYAKDPTVTAEFYRDVMGMQIVGGSSADAPIGASAFLSSRPEEESHEIALFTNPEIRHVAFKVASLAELRSFYQRICARKLPVKMAANHGASLAFYFDDPDGNMIEVYWPTGVKCRQPFIEPLDLTQREEALRATLRLDVVAHRCRVRRFEMDNLRTFVSSPHLRAHAYRDASSYSLGRKFVR